MLTKFMQVYPCRLKWIRLSLINFLISFLSLFMIKNNLSGTKKQEITRFNLVDSRFILTHNILVKFILIYFYDGNFLKKFNVLRQVCTI